MHGMVFGRRGSCVGGVLLGLLGAGTAAHGAVLVSDNFDSVAGGASINGRAPSTTVNGAKWVASTVDLLGNGAGGLGGDSTKTSSAFVDLGASYLSTNPGLYELSVDITQPTTMSTDTSWIGFGFAQGSAAKGGAPDVGQQFVINGTNGNGGAPWLLYRLNGAVATFGGPSNTNGAGSGTTASLGNAHTFKLQLDTSSATWLLNGFIDGAQVDLNGSANAGNTYSYAGNTSGNPTASHYVGVATAQNTGQVGTVGTVDNFVLTGPVPAPEPGTVGLLGLAGFGLLAKRRRR
jgi:hypothetical protein